MKSNYIWTQTHTQPDLENPVKHPLDGIDNTKTARTVLLRLCLGQQPDHPVLPSVVARLLNAKIICVVAEYFIDVSEGVKTRVPVYSVSMQAFEDWHRWAKWMWPDSYEDMRQTALANLRQGLTR